MNWLNLPQPIIALAAMDGVTDTVFRQICRSWGADLAFTEFIHSTGLIRSKKYRDPILKYVESERPVIVQIYGNNPEDFYTAAKFVLELGFDGIDINMGCPSKSVAGHGSGCALMRKPELASEIVKNVLKARDEFCNYPLFGKGTQGDFPAVSKAFEANFLRYNENLKERARTLRKNMTPAEKELWYKYLKKIEVNVLRQRSIENFIVDFYIPSKKLVIEIDSCSHYSDEAKIYDQYRTQILESLGLSVLRFTNTDIHNNFEGVCQVINKELQETGKSPLAPLYKKRGKEIPVTVKMRIGYDEIIGPDFARTLEDAGAEGLIVHGRTLKMGYSGLADWSVIGEVAKSVKIPVIGNGDVKSADDIKKALDLGCAGVTIGRASMGNPFVFYEIKKELGLDVSEIEKRFGISSPEDLKLNFRINTYLNQIKIAQDTFGEKGFIESRKHVSGYVHSFPNASELRHQLVFAKSIEEVEGICEGVKG